MVGSLHPWSRRPIIKVNWPGRSGLTVPIVLCAGLPGAGGRPFAGGSSRPASAVHAAATVDAVSEDMSKPPGAGARGPGRDALGYGRAGHGTGVAAGPGQGCPSWCPRCSRPRARCRRGRLGRRVRLGGPALPRARPPGPAAAAFANGRDVTPSFPELAEPLTGHAPRGGWCRRHRRRRRRGRPAPAPAAATAHRGRPAVARCAAPDPGGVHRRRPAVAGRPRPHRPALPPAPRAARRARPRPAAGRGLPDVPRGRGRGRDAYRGGVRRRGAARPPPRRPVPPGAPTARLGAGPAAPVRGVVVGGWTPADPSAPTGSGRCCSVCPIPAPAPGCGTSDGSGSARGRSSGRSVRTWPDCGVPAPRSPRPLPPAVARDAQWVAPGLAGRVEFTDWTADGRLRLPAWRGLAVDVPLDPAGPDAGCCAARPRSPAPDGIVGRAEAGPGEVAARASGPRATDEPCPRQERLPQDAALPRPPAATPGRRSPAAAGPPMAAERGRCTPGLASDRRVRSRRVPGGPRPAGWSSTSSTTP